ncbi:MAG: HEAT repeat domain-containing protein [Myxococcota bacterium]
MNPLGSTAPLRVLHQQGRQAMRAGNAVQAGELLRQAATHKTSAREAEYRPMLDDLREVFVALDKPRHALSVDWYRGEHRAARELLDRVPPIDRARTLQAWAVRTEDPKQHLEAASIYESASMVAHAAICREKGEDFATARTLWSRLGDALSQDGHELYAAGLARFNLARCCVRVDDERAARNAVVSAVHLLEEAADRYERIGQRERAFDCYQVLIAIGERSGEYEHVLEGYVNVVRILREDNLRYYALQSYEDAITKAERQREFTAGATLAAEMASYAEAEGMSNLANHATDQQARMWRQVANAVIERGGAIEMAENALLAAIVALARQSQFASVGNLYEVLAGLELEPSRREHYARAAKRYAGVQNANVDASPLPSHLRQDAAFPDVWHVDLVEWEQRGAAAQACGDIVLDAETWSEVTRRRALVARLQALDIDAQGAQTDPDALVVLARLLGQVELYSILSPLEQLYRHRSEEVRRHVVEALERFMYKRTFVTMRAALTDEDGDVRRRAYETVEALRFPHAFDPLARIFRESSDREARTSALKAIARIDTREAADLLLGVFQHEGREERAVAAEALKRARGQLFLTTVRQAFSGLTPEVQTELRGVFQARGEAI